MALRLGSKLPGLPWQPATQPLWLRHVGRGASHEIWNDTYLQLCISAQLHFPKSNYLQLNFFKLLPPLPILKEHIYTYLQSMLTESTCIVLQI